MKDEEHANKAARKPAPGCLYPFAYRDGDQEEVREDFRYLLGTPSRGTVWLLDIRYDPEQSCQSLLCGRC